jgi:hypothetical protein
VTKNNTVAVGNEKPGIPCPYAYAKGRKCKGHIIRIEAYKADLSWELKDGKWVFGYGKPRSHYHVFCSEKNNHARCGRPDDDHMNFYLQDLAKELLQALSSSERR